MRRTIRILGICCLPVAAMAWPQQVSAQGRVIAVSAAQYDFDRVSRSRRRAWAAGLRVGLPVLADRAELSLLGEYSFAGNVSNAPTVIGLLARFTHMGRSRPDASVRPNLFLGLGVLHFRTTWQVYSVNCCRGTTTSLGWQLIGSAGFGFALAVSPDVRIAPRVSGLVPLMRRRGPEAGGYVRWSLSLDWYR